MKKLDMTSSPVVNRTVAVDFDGVLSQYHKWQGPNHFEPPIEGATAFLARLRSRGYHVVIHTARVLDHGENDYKAIALSVEKWLNFYSVPYDEIWARAGKPAAFAYVDDRAVPCTPMVGGKFEYTMALDNIDYLRKKAK